MRAPLVEKEEREGEEGGRQRFTFLLLREARSNQRRGLRTRWVLAGLLGGPGWVMGLLGGWARLTPPTRSGMVFIR